MDEANLNQEAEKKGGKKKIGIYILVGAILLLAGVNVYLLLGRKESAAPVEVEETRRDVVSPDNVDEMVERMTAATAPAAYYVAQMNYTWHFPNGTAPSEDAYVANPEENSNDVYFDLVLEEDESQVLYRSPVIPVGMSMEHFALDTPLEAGTYHCVAIYHLVDEDQNTISTVRVSVTVVIDW